MSRSLSQTFQSNEQKLNTGKKKKHTHNHTYTPTYSAISLKHTHTQNTEKSHYRPVLQIWHGEISADEAHPQADDLSVFGRGGAAVFGRAGVLAAAVAGRLWADTVPGQVGHKGRLLEERGNLTDVLHCGGREESININQRTSDTRWQD